MSGIKENEIVEKEMTSEEVHRIHAFGRCWIKDYDQRDRKNWEVALYLFAWDRKIVWNDLRREVPCGL